MKRNASEQELEVGFLRHLERIEDEISNVYTLNTLSKWVERFVYLEGERYSFKNYEFQRDVLDDSSRVVNVVKCAQIGLTTVTMAYLLSVLATQRKMNVIYALPSANDATKLTTTKLNPLIYGTPELRRLLNVNVDSSELKEINGNFLYIRGTRSETAALSVSADLLIIDELDRCDYDVVKQFRSRLQASPHKMVKQFSTPTIDGVGISKEAEASVRYRHFATCAHCNHKFLPSYWTDIHIPGFDKPMTEIDRLNLKDIAWRDGRWNCPSCHKDPMLDASRLSWVAENPTENYEAATYYVTPVTAHKVLTPSYLIRASTEFNTVSEYRNQVLGETSQDDNQQITAQDVEKAFTTSPLDSSNLHCLGADIGQMCAVTIGRMLEDGTLLIVHKENVPLSNFAVRRRQLCAQYRVVVSVHDIMPETYMIGQITESDPNAWACLFTTSRTTELYTTAQKVEDAEEGKLNLRMVKANRTAVLDKLMSLFKSGKIVVQRNAESGKFMSQMLSLKRSQTFVKDELTWSWVKTDSNDHYMFSATYLMLACLLRGTAAGWVGAGAVPLVSSFRLKS